MHTGHDNNLIGNNTVVKSVRETRKKCATGLTMDNGTLQGVRHHGFHNHVRRCEKLFAKTSLLSLVPSVSIFKRPQRPRDELSVASPGAAADLLEDLFPGNAFRP
jgi:hypothetical protein